MTQSGMKAAREMVTIVWPVLVLVSVSAMAKDCTMPRRTVTYRVHWVILRRPSSPSFWSFASGS